MTPFGTPFSLATASTTSNSSLLMTFAPSGTTLRPNDFFPVFDSAARMFIDSFLPALFRRTFLVFAARRREAERRVVRCEARLGDVRVRDRHRLAVLLDRDAVALDVPDRAVEPAAAVERQVDVDLHGLSD